MQERLDKARADAAIGKLQRDDADGGVLPASNAEPAGSAALACGPQSVRGVECWLRHVQLPAELPCVEPYDAGGVLIPLLLVKARLPALLSDAGLWRGCSAGGTVQGCGVVQRRGVVEGCGVVQRRGRGAAQGVVQGLEWFSAGGWDKAVGRDGAVGRDRAEGQDRAMGGVAVWGVDTPAWRGAAGRSHASAELTGRDAFSAGAAPSECIMRCCSRCHSSRACGLRLPVFLEMHVLLVQVMTQRLPASLHERRS
eukprot:358826-Chlamydomonas_euryale.AAC.21